MNFCRQRCNSRSCCCISLLINIPWPVAVFKVLHVQQKIVAEILKSAWISLLKCLTVYKSRFGGQETFAYIASPNFCVIVLLSSVFTRDSRYRYDNLGTIFGGPEIQEGKKLSKFDAISDNF